MPEDILTGAASPASQGTPAGDGQPGANTPADPGTTQQQDTPPGDQTPNGDGAAPVVPEKYQFTLPDGLTADETVTKFESIFRDLKLSNDDAQKLVSAYAEIKLEEGKSIDTRLEEQHNTWKQAVLNDPEMGGTNFPATEKAAQSAVARFGTPALKSYLNSTGLGSHPELVRTFAAIGRAMAEDTIHTGKPSGSENNLFDLYPSMKPKD